jgi:glycosyltransferase involved in cell wall biosynthesis
MSKKMISILISNYNKGKYINECLRSCFLQNYSNLEVIVFDNFSTDDSLSIIKKYNKVSVYKKKKISLYPAVNQMDLLISAFKKSKGEIMLLLDSDDYFFRNKTKKILNFFDKNSNKNFLLDCPVILNNNKKKEFFIKRNSFSSYVWPTIFPTSSISFRKEFFLENQEFLLKDRYPLLEIDFRLIVINFIVNKDFSYLFGTDKLTLYRNVSDGIMSNSKRFSSQWWKKRLQAFNFFQDILNNNGLKFKISADFLFTKLMNKILSL